MIVFRKTVTMHSYLSTSLLFYLLILIPGFGGSVPDNVNQLEEKVKSDEVRRKNQTVTGVESPETGKSPESCISQLNHMLNGAKSASGLPLVWNESYYQEYDKSDLQRIAVKDIEENLESKDCASALKSLKSPKVNGNTFCNEFASRIPENTPPRSVEYMIRQWRNSSDCKLACYKNVLGEVYPYCQLILVYYTKEKVSPIPDENKPGNVNASNISPQSNSVTPVDQGSEDTHLSAEKVQKNTKKAEDIDVGLTNPSNIEDNGDEDVPPEAQEPKDDSDKNVPQIPANLVGAESNNKVYSPQSLNDTNSEDSHFFIYFILMSGVCILFYIMMYNKKKILALAIEGRRRSAKRRPNSALYRKLDCNLEEAMASGPSTSTSNALLY